MRLRGYPSVDVTEARSHLSLWERSASQGRERVLEREALLMDAFRTDRHNKAVQQSITSRQKFLEDQGWYAIRFSNEDVLKDVEAVAISIAKPLGLDVSFGRRVRVASGMRCKDG